MSHYHDAIIRWRHIYDVTCSKSSFEFRVLGWLNMILIQSKNLSKIIFFVIHEKTWISWYSRILTNLKFFYLLIYQLVQYLRSRYHYSYLYWSSFCQKSPRFLSKLALCLLFCQFSPKSLIFNFWLFNFCFWLFWYFQSLFQNEDDLRWSCFLIFDLWPFAFWPFVLSLGTFHPN